MLNKPVSFAVPDSTVSLRYMPGLDVLRGLAISMVFLFHILSPAKATFSPSSYYLVRHIPEFFSLGRLGVHLFFILSGFLITGILLDTRRDPDYFRNFYLRRALRIVPIYVLLMVFLLVFKYVDVRYFVVCLLYFSNMTGLFHSQPQYGPLWSLSVEEQFYLFWPFVVLKLSRRALAWVSAGIIVLTPFLRFALLHGPIAFRDPNFKTWVVCDFFAAGALIALAIRVPLPRAQLRRIALILTSVGLVLAAVTSYYMTELEAFSTKLFASAYLEPWLLLFSGLTLLAFLYPQIATSSLAARVLVFLSGISYGLYLIHQLVINGVEKYLPLGNLSGHNLNSHPILAKFLQLAIDAVLAIAIAWISRNTVEKYFLSLKPKHRHAARAETA